MKSFLKTHLTTASNKPSEGTFTKEPCHVCLLVCLFMFACLFVHIFCLFVCLFVHVYLSVCSYVCLSVCFSSTFKCVMMSLFVMVERQLVL